jgi:hypothetical protein
LFGGRRIGRPNGAKGFRWRWQERAWYMEIDKTNTKKKVIERVKKEAKEIGKGKKKGDEN